MLVDIVNRELLYIEKLSLFHKSMSRADNYKSVSLNMITDFNMMAFRVNTHRI